MMQNETDNGLDAIIAQYLNADEKGQPLNREQVLEKHPQLAAELKEYFSDRDRFTRTIRPKRQVVPATARSFGDYELLEEIARGGMGIVYKATQTSLGRTVAVKMILAGHLASPGDVRRFRTEAESAAGLQHPHIVAIHEIGDHEGRQYFCMEYIDGPSLAELVRERPLPPRRAAACVKQAAEAVAYAHQQGILHRDLKPSNILVDATGRVRITDFGLAGRMEANESLTRSGQMQGTASYISPEQAEGERGLIGPQTDVYSLGAVLYELLTGHPPFRADSAVETLHQVVTAEPASPRLVNRAVPRDLETICRKCLEKTPHERYFTAHMLADDLGRYLVGLPITARPVDRLTRSWRWCRREPAVASMSAVVVLLFMIVILTTSLILPQLFGRRTGVADASGTNDDLVSRMNEKQLGRTEPPRAIQTPILRRVDAAQVDPTGAPRSSEMRMITPVRCLRAHQDGAVVALEMIVAEGLHTACFSHDGAHLAVVDVGRVRIWAVRDGRELPSLKGDLGQCFYDVGFSPNGRWITAVGRGGVLVWDARSRKEVAAPKSENMAYATRVAFSPDSEHLLVGRSKGASIWRTDGWDLHCEIPCKNSWFSGLAFSPDGRWLAACGQQADVVIYGLDGEPDGKFVGGVAMFYTLAVSTGGEFLAASGPRSLVVWDSDSREVRYSLPRLNRHVAAFSPDGTILATADRNHEIVLRDAQSGREVIRLEGHAASINSAIFSPDGTQLVTASRDGQVIVWNLPADVTVETL